jgi:hypothetical protein
MPLTLGSTRVMVRLFCEDGTPPESTKGSHNYFRMLPDEFIEDPKMKVILMQAYAVAAAMTMVSDG